MINADNKKTISRNSSNLIYSDLTYKIRGAIFSVYNELGSGHKETVYQKALLKEFNSLEIEYETEKYLKVKYKGENVGSYRPDIVVGNKIILELKAVEFMPKIFENQLAHLLKNNWFQAWFIS